MQTATAQSNGFSIGDVARRVDDLSERRPLIYWTDFSISLVIGYTAATWFMWAPPAGLVNSALLAIVACCGLYRAALFIHEVVHLRRGELPGFATVWNLAAGIPMLMPTFSYETHLEHHRASTYGTADDGEYLPLAKGALSDAAEFLVQVFAQPVLVFLRFAVLCPLSFLHPTFRRWTLERASSLVINMRVRRRIPSDAPLTQWALVDLACCVRAWLLVLPVLTHALPWTYLLRLMLIACGTLGLNYYRTLAAHRYQSDGLQRSHAEQMLDSTNITGRPIVTELVCPVGLRYHALHHLLPSLPYHSLGAAHERLMATLPPGSPYRATVFPSTFAAIADLIRHARAERRNRAAENAI